MMMTKRIEATKELVRSILNQLSWEETGSLTIGAPVDAAMLTAPVESTAAGALVRSP
jgi:hypothetical protein